METWKELRTLVHFLFFVLVHMEVEAMNKS